MSQRLMSFMNKHTGQKNRYRDYSFDYKGVKTDWGVHGIHPYPAMMIYPIARRIILEYSREGDYILDPFAGSGTVLVESLLHNRNSSGFDINPLALLLARVKTTPIDGDVLLEALKKVTSTEKNSVTIPEFFNRDFWFKKEVSEKLAHILANINSVEDGSVADFFKVAFSETVRLVSNTRNGEFKLLRIKELSKHNPNVFDIFKRISEDNIHKMSQTYAKCVPQTAVDIFEFDSTVINGRIEPESVDLILTSPPYGDSKTTVAYGQFSRLTLQWLGYGKVNIDKESLGGVNRHKDTEIPSSLLVKTVKRISSKDPKRAEEVVSFFFDLNLCLGNLFRYLKRNGHLCIVVGNRTVKQITIPTDMIITEICRRLGFEHIKTIIRAIPSKRMPKANSPTNIKGRTEQTMNEEYVIILKKTRENEF